MAQLVKTICGLPLASVKTLRGLAIASAKTICGLDNTAATYDPSTDADVAFWWKADGTVLNTSDAQCGNGDTVKTWVGSKGAKDLINIIDTGKRPTFNATGGPASKPYVDFSTATNKFLYVNCGVTLTQPYSVYVVVAPITTSELGVIFDSFDSSSRALLYMYTDAKWAMYAGASAFPVAGTTSFAITKSVFKGASNQSYFSLNGSSDYTGLDTGTGSWTPITVGNYYEAASTGGRSKICEVIIQNVETTNAAAVLGYLNTKYAIY